MAILRRSLAALALVLLFLCPVTAHAQTAPTLTITPPSAPVGTEITVTGSGFLAGAPLSAVLEVEPVGRIPVIDVVAAPDGTVRFTFRLPGSVVVPPGGIELPLLVVAGNTDPRGAALARTVLRVTDAPAVASERVSVSPASGPAGTRFVVSGAGFPPGRTVQVTTAPSATGPSSPPERVRIGSEVRVGADGRFTDTVNSMGYLPDGYSVAVFAVPLTGPPFVARLTVTAGGTAGTVGLRLPNTGARASAGAPTGAGGFLLVALGLVGLGLRHRFPTHRAGP